MNRQIKYRRTIKGFITTTYLRQKESSKQRGHIMPLYNMSELHTWVISQDNFSYLWNNWVKYDYDKSLRPSIDRINDVLPYSINNIQLTTWYENNKKSHNNRRNGIDTSRSIEVKQYGLSGNYINKYHSSHEAMRITGVHQGNIIQVCKGKRNKAGDFIWTY